MSAAVLEEPTQSNEEETPNTTFTEDAGSEVTQAEGQGRQGETLEEEDEEELEDDEMDEDEEEDEDLEDEDDE